MFASVPGTNSQADSGKVYVLNIDPEDKPQELENQPGLFEPNTQKWHDVIDVLEVEKGVEGISPTSDPNVMVFTNRVEDFKGFGRIKVTNEDPTEFAASVSYTALGLGSTNDYFDVNDARDVVITSDGKYGFIAGANARNFGSGIPSIDGPKAGSNVGIIVDPLTENAKLVAATRPIPNGFTSSVSISSDDKYLFASYPGGGGVYAWDVEEMIETLENPGEFVIDHLGRGVGSPIFLPSTQKTATKADFDSVPIDNINPDIAIASDLQLIEESYIRNEFEFGVPTDSKRAPLTIGGNPWSVTNASHRDWLNLLPVNDPDLTPDFAWEFDEDPEKVKEINLYVSVFPDGQGLLPGDTWDGLNNLEDSSILPSLTTEQKRRLLGVKDSDTGIWDYNPNRILTASWKKNENGGGEWYFPDGTLIEDPGELNTMTNFSLPDNRTLTAGQKYYWAVEGIKEDGTPSGTKIGQFETSVPEPIVEGDVFSNVTVLTHGFVPPYIQDDVIPPSFFEMADSIANPGTKTEGLVMKYDRATGYWVPVDENGAPVEDFPSSANPGGDPEYLSNLKNYIAPYIAQKAPLVLIPDWAGDFESATPDSGFTEAAADAFYASLVQLDQKLGGEIGKDTADGFQLYDETTGEIIRKQGSLFNSSLHFVGFSRGIVVNSEIIQRLGTFYPLAGGFKTDLDNNKIPGSGDLQMTTLDPHDFNQPGLKFPILGDFSNFGEPKVQVWDNVTFADNYFQTVPDLTGNTLTPAGRDIPNVPDTENQNNDTRRIDNPTTGYPLNPKQGTLLGVPNHSIRLGANTNDSDNYENSRAGFTRETDPIPFFYDGTGAVHGRVNSWYTGTANFDLTEFPDQIYRRRGDGYYEHLFDPEFYSLERDPRFNPWYTPDFLSEDDPNSFKLGEANAPWEGIGTGWFYSALGGGIEKRPESTTDKVPVEFDNTYNARMRGDFAVPTLFNGNFDAVFRPDDSRTLFNKVPGWSFHFDDELDDINDLTIDKLVEWSEIPSLKTYREQIGYDPSQPNYALKMDDDDSIVHNRFIVPDWGALRFDVYVPNPGTGNVRIFINDQELQSSAFQGVQKWFPRANESDYPAVNLEKFDLEGKDAVETLGQSNRVGFAKQGFQTFQVDIPNEFRGKIATLKFKVSGIQEIYLDNVFFKSQNLLFGSPQKLINDSSGDYQQARKDVDTPKFKPGYSTRITENPDTQFSENYLLEKPQYSLSYNSLLKTPNWVSYQLNETWLGNYSSRVKFQNDPRSPFVVKVEDEDIKALSNYQKGHMSAAADRSRNEQDYKTTFITSNILPQPLNKPNGDPWTNLETDLRNYARDRDGELYIVAGRYGQAVDEFGVPILLPEYDPQKDYDPNNPSDIPNKVSVPQSVWKIVLVNNQPGQGIQDITKETLAFAINLDNTLDSNKNAKYPNGDWTETDITIDGLPVGLINIDKLEEITGYDFLSNIPAEIQEAIEGRKYPDILEKIYAEEIKPRPTSSLLASTTRESTFVRSLFDSSIGHDSIPNQIALTTDDVFRNIDISEDRFNQNSPFKTETRQFSPSEISAGGIHMSQNGISQVSFDQTTPEQVSRIQGGFSENSTSEIGAIQNSTSEVGTAEIHTTERGFKQISSSQVDPLETNPLKLSPLISTKMRESNTSKVPFSFVVSNNQFFSSNANHNSTTQIINELNDSAIKIWSDLLQSDTQLDIDFQITDLPTGQLAEATITGFDDTRNPNTGTIFIDRDANGVGWFVDQTPLDNSEFSGSRGAREQGSRGETYLLAAIESEANGKYDLLTTVLHELAHLYGFIEGYAGFDANVETKNGTTQFIGDNFEAVLDGEHLDKEAHPHDLMNTHLAPGMRKLPSELNVQILQAILAEDAGAQGRRGAGEKLEAALTSEPLLAIANGDFSITDTTTDSFAWDTRGASGIEDGQAVLTEDSPFLSNFTQTFTVPEEAKTIQFKLIGAELGASELAPPDAFEVALLDANTNESLTDLSDLNNTDSLLNIQNDGTAYFSDKVRIGGATSGEIIGLDRPRTVTVDISDLTPGTEATLYFDLLGFGDVDSRVVIDDVRLSDQFLLPPVANNDTAIVTQGETVEIDILANDTDDDGTLASDSVQITTESTGGTATVNNNGTVSYTPSDRFVGEDSFSYTVQDNDEQSSETATVEIVVENAIPVISDLQIPDTVTEGVEVTLGAISSDAGNDELTYSWTIDGESQTENNPQINYTFADNGTYAGSVTVTDTHGDSVTQTFEVTVENAVPVVDAGSDVTVNEGSAVEFNGSYSDTGINDTHTVSWDFGDGDTADTSEVSHTYTDDGEYTATYTVTDNDGAVASDTVEVTVNNVAPVIESLTGDTEINEGDTATFNAIASDPGNDTIAYIWNFGDGSEQLSVGNEELPVSHTYSDNGDYTVTLTVRDEDGGETSQTIDVTVNNVTPTFTEVNGETVVNEGEVTNYSAAATDPGDDELTYTWSFDGGTSQVELADINHVFAQDGTYDATVTVTDDDGASSTETLSITVNNVAPSIETDLEMKVLQLNLTLLSPTLAPML